MHSRSLFAFSLLMTLACGGAPEPAETEAAQDHGAGTVVKANPGLDTIVPADYTIEKLAGGFIFIEGPAWVRGWPGSPFLLFSDVRGNATYKWDLASGQTSDFKKPNFEGEYEDGRGIGSNGITMDKDGNVLIAEHGNRRIAKVTKSGEWSTLVDNWEGKKLNSPNDMTWHSNGWLYFTDPPYGLAKQDDDPDKEIPFNGIFRLSPDGKTVEKLGEQTRPNGIGFSPDEKTLYVANSDPNQKVWFAYPVEDDGTLGERRVFANVTSETAEGVPDGLKLDTAGNLYGTGPGGVWIFSPDGAHLGTLQPDEVPANVGWGNDGKTLYMTARTGLYRMNLLASGKLP